MPAMRRSNTAHALQCLQLLRCDAQASKAQRPGKVPLEKGYSQMDWMRTMRTHPDLAGACGAAPLHQLRAYSLHE